MGLSLRTNVASLNAQRNLAQAQSSVDASMSKLSSGMRITKAGDDAAGLAISSKMQAQIKSYNQAARNANDGLSVIQTAEAAMNTTTNILTRLRELAMQSASAGVGDKERQAIQTEATALTNELDRNAKTAKFNGTDLLNNTSSLSFQVGIDASGDSQISVAAVDVTASALGVEAADISFASAASAQAALTVLDTAIETVSTNRATFGAAGNRFQAVIENIQTFAESLSTANSRIRDVDVAEETSNMAKSQILVQAGISVLSQANQSPQMALKLLG
jgi:flagellin